MIQITVGDPSEEGSFVFTVNPDARLQAAPLTEVVVGVKGACSYRGQLLFDLSSLVYDAPTVASATLWLYAPTQTGPTGVQLFQNAPPTLQPWQMPSWNTATQVLTGTMGLAEGVGNGNWHRWDVTSAVQQWLRDPSSNGGLTLDGTGLPVRFSSPLAANSSDPSLAPYLDIQYAAPATATSMAGTAGMTGTAPRISPHITCTNRGYCDGANFIYGIAGSFAVDTPNNPYHCSAGARLCSAGPTGDVTTLQGLINGQQSIGTGQPGPGAVYMRLGVQLECVRSKNAAIPRAWWTSSSTRQLSVPALGGAKDYAPLNNIGTILELVSEAAARGVIPIVTLVPDHSRLPNQAPCATDPNTDMSWYNQAASLAKAIISAYPSNKFIYYEIGNEQNVQGNASAYQPSYPVVYAESASAIVHAYTQARQLSNVRVLTGGVLDPASDTNPNDCATSPDPVSLPPQSPSYIQTIERALSLAEGRFHLLASYLGVAVHPYGYSTTETSLWQNYHDPSYTYVYDSYVQGNTKYYDRTANIYDGPCRDLAAMLNLWLGATSTPGTAVFANLPLIFTEDNWQSAFTSIPNKAVAVGLADQVHNSGAYLVDLFSWMHYYGLDITDISPVRVMWDRGEDEPGLRCDPQGSDVTDPNPNACLGLFTNSSLDKYVTISHCPSNQAQGTQAMAFDFYWLRAGPCN